MKLFSIASTLQLADMFPKALSWDSLSMFLSKFGMIDIHHPPVCGGLTYFKVQPKKNASKINKLEEEYT